MVPSHGELSKEITDLACVSWMIDVGVHCSSWMYTEGRLWRRREQYRHRRDRETPKEVERRRCRNQKYLRRPRAATTMEQRRLVRTSKLAHQFETLYAFSVIHSLTWMSYLSWQVSLKCHWNYFLCFEQQQNGSAYWHALTLINHGDASDSEDIGEWDWRSMLEYDDQDNHEYCTTSDNDELVNHLLHLWTTSLL